MIDYTDVDAKLDEYSEAFDFYMERGEIPPQISEEDFLASFMKEVIDSNPQIDGSDPIWVEVLKEGLISFFTALLDQFIVLQLEAMKELSLIVKFSQVPIEQKRLMWQEVHETISRNYSKFEVNLPGFTSQFKCDDKNPVFAALTSDWESACKEKLARQQRQILEHSRQQFEIICRDAGTADYEDKKRVERYIHKYPQLKEIVDMIGRDKNPTKEENDTVVYQFMPSTVLKNSSVEDIDRVESGNNLERVLAVELSMPEELFYKRFVTKELQQFSNPGQDKPKKIEEHRKDPRLTKGPIIVSVDTSNSMKRRPLKIAFSLLKQLLRMAKKQKRPCFLINFSVRSKSIDLSKPRNWGRLENFLVNSFSGGTDGEQMLSEAIKILQKGTFEMADVLIISDLEFPKPTPATMEKINKEKALGTRYYALQIGGRKDHEYKDVLDKTWHI